MLEVVSRHLEASALLAQDATTDESRSLAAVAKCLWHDALQSGDRKRFPGMPQLTVLAPNVAQSGPHGLFHHWHRAMMGLVIYKKLVGEGI